MNPPEAFLYDVAFSFLSEDEHLARELNDRLCDRVTTFIYSDSERQEHLLGGRDGEESFAKVFGEQARTVLVLYREGWGKSGFTAAESTAIRNRAMEFGYDFTTFMPLDVPPTVPRWLPKNRIWVGLERWGIETVAAIVESKIREAGGEPRPETVADVAARLRRDLNLEAERRSLLDSTAGVEAARASFEALRSAVLKAVDDGGGLLQWEASANPGLFTMKAGRRRTTMVFELTYNNTTTGSKLRINEVFVPGGQPLHQHVTEYSFDIGRDSAHGWRANRDPASRLLTSRQLADIEAKKLLEHLVVDAVNS